jgi:acyl-CoA synthetase (AMP-forming)/AMP-acid ligase II
MVEVAGGVAVKVSPPGLVVPLAGLLGIPLPRYRMRVIDEEGTKLRSGEVGELVVRGPGVMRGYHGQPAGDDVLTPDGWLRTGDLARRRRLGLIEFVGRKKDVIKHGGYSVFPAEVEAVLQEHPAVAEAVVLGFPDPVKGEVPAAAIRLRTDHTARRDDIRSFAAERLAEYKVPVRVGFVEEFPRTGTDKVAKRALLDVLLGGSD